MSMQLFYAYSTTLRFISFEGKVYILSFQDCSEVQHRLIILNWMNSLLFTKIFYADEKKFNRLIYF